MLATSNGSGTAPGAEGEVALEEPAARPLRLDAVEDPARVYEEEFDIPTDAYGSAILAIVKDSPEVFCGSCSGIVCIRLVFAMLLLILNLVLQFSILFFINTQVVNHSVRHVQEIYRAYHENSYSSEGRFEPDLWAAEDGKSELCQIAMTSRLFYYCILFLWTVSMLQELRQGERLIRNIYKVPACTRCADMIETPGQITYIKRLTRPVRIALLAFVCLPKLLIAITLLKVGWRWLSATTSFEELVMNSVAMEFVTRIDNMLYEFAVPESYKKEVTEINFLLQTSAKTEAKIICDEWKSYMRSGGYLVLAVALVFSYADYLQDVLPPGIHDVKDHCAAWLEVEERPICLSFWESLLSGKSYDSCYPYGDASNP